MKTLLPQGRWRLVVIAPDFYNGVMILLKYEKSVLYYIQNRRITIVVIVLENY